jgi:hypothetical protein
MSASQLSPSTAPAPAPVDGGSKTMHAPAARCVHGVGVIAAMSLTSAPWVAVMITSLVLASLQAAVTLVPIVLAHRRAVAADRMADARLRSLIKLRRQGAKIAAADFVACGGAKPAAS